MSQQHPPTPSSSGASSNGSSAASSTTSSSAPLSADITPALVSAAVEQAHIWLDVKEEGSSSTKQLANLVQDPDGVAFTMDFVDRVARPEDDATAAAALSQIEANARFLGVINNAALSLGTKLAPALPWLVMPLARMRLRQMVGHLVLDAGSRALDSLLDKAASAGNQLNLNLLGEAVLGDEEAASRQKRTLKLVSNPKVTYVSVKASSLCAQLNPWDKQGSIIRLKEALTPIYRAAQANGVFINLDMEEYKDLSLTIELFTQLLSAEEFRDLKAGIVLQAYLPDSLAALEELAAFAAQRVKDGGAPIKIRLVKGANLSMERVEAHVHGWAQAPYASKREVDANYLRLIDFIVRPEHAENVRIGIASHNLYNLAFAKELAAQRGVSGQLDAEMLQGMSPAQAKLVSEVFGELILYTPVVAADDFDVAVSYLVRRLEENAAKENFLYALFAPENSALEQQEEIFRWAVANFPTLYAAPRRTQDRTCEHGRQAPRNGRFVNEPDTDPALQANREWALAALAATPHTPQAELITDPAAVEQPVARARELAAGWSTRSGHERAKVLDTIADNLADLRGELITVMAHEAGKSVDQSDPEISEAIDFATYYAESARALDSARSLFTAHQVTVVTPPWNFPVAIPAGGVLSALAAGSAVIIKPAPEVQACAEVMLRAVHAGLDEHGIDRDLVQLLNVDEGPAGQALLSHDSVDHIILTGASETAALFRSWRPAMNLSAETSGKNAIIVTPAADPDLAVADIYRSAFGHSGQKCSAASLLILVGAAGESERIKTQLIDAASTLITGPGTDIRTTMNGLISPPGEKLLRGLTRLEEGESWLLKPRKLDEEGYFYSPGIRDNVAPGSWFHTHECFGPVLGIMYAATLEEAVQWQNSTGYGLTGGLHSLDKEEITYWAKHVEVGNAYINRGITGAIVQRQPFGGWKNSVIGAGAKAGGPNYVAQQGTWSDQPFSHPQVELIRPVHSYLHAHTELPEEDLRWLRAAAELDQLAWEEEFGREHDLTGLECEANIFRYRPLLSPLEVRVGPGYRLREVLRLELGAARTGTRLRISAGPNIAAELAAAGVHAVAQSADAFAVRIAEASGVRVRALGEVDSALLEAAASSGSVVLSHPVLADGRRELLPLLLEQALSVTLHRFGVIREQALSPA